MKPNTEKELLEKILIELQKQNRPNLTINFTRGLITGLGVALGTSVLVAMIIILLRNLVTAPVIGTYVKEVVEFVESSRNR
jgi:hypothetical protein